MAGSARLSPRMYLMPGRSEVWKDGLICLPCRVRCHFMLNQVEKKTIEELGDGVTRETSLNSKLNLVDLAGSERSKKTGATGSTLKEGSSINK